VLCPTILIVAVTTTGQSVVLLQVDRCLDCIFLYGHVIGTLYGVESQRITVDVPWRLNGRANTADYMQVASLNFLGCDQNERISQVDSSTFLLENNEDWLPTHHHGSVYLEHASVWREVGSIILPTWIRDL
jgi:hypothetical protein